MSPSKMVLSVIGSVAAGALMGVLFAPEKGSETRKKIKSKANDGVDALKDKLDSLLETMNNKCENILEAKDKLIAEGETEFNLVKKEFKNL